MNLIEKIMNSRYKYCIVAMIIMCIIFVVGVLCINTTVDSILDKNVSYTEFTVVDKYVSNDNEHYYVVVSDQGSTYEIANTDEGVNLFNRIAVGSHYHFVIQGADDSQHIHIIQVYNETS